MARVTLWLMLSLFSCLFVMSDLSGSDVFWWREVGCELLKVGCVWWRFRL